MTSADPGALVSTTDLVVVAINSRIGLWGGLHLGTYEDSDPARTNLQLSDHLLALAWIHNNIAQFGGNPSNITIAGNSSGARNILALLAASPASTHFSKAIVMSSGSPRTQTAAQARAVIARFAHLLDPIGHTDRLLQASNRLLRQIHAELSRESPVNYDPVLDGTILPDNETALWANITTSGKPLLITLTSGEGDFFKQFGTESVWRRLERLHRDQGRPVDASNPLDDACDIDSACHILARELFIKPAMALAAETSRHGTSVSVAIYDNVAAEHLDLGLTRAAHGSDLRAFFHGAHGFADSTDQRIAQDWQRLVTTFCTTGTPTTNGAVGDIPPHTLATTACAVIGKNARLTTAEDLITSTTATGRAS